MAGGSIVAAFAYRGAAGEGYSLLSHWVSELGEAGVSPLAGVFNVALMVSGLGFATFMGALSLVRRGSLGAAFGALGIGAGFFAALVGVFPLGASDLHVAVAAGYFVLGSLAIALASIELVRRPDAAFPAWLGLFGGIVVGAFVGFILVTSGRGGGTDEARPALVLEPTLEWAAIIGTLAWTALVSWSWRRARA